MVHIRRRDKMGINMDLLVSGDQIQKNFGVKRLQIKMSFLLNVLNASKPEEFSIKGIEVLVDNKEQNWLKRAHIGRYLGISRVITLTIKLPGEDIRS